MGDRAMPCSWDRVTDLALYRSKRGRKGTHSGILYLSDEASYLPSLRKASGEEVTAITREESLTEFLSFAPPNIVIIESDLSWGEPLALIQHLHSRWSLSVVLLIENRKTAPKAFIKKAYEAGISDVLYCPLDDDEVQQTLGLLSQFVQSSPQG